MRAADGTHIEDGTRAFNYYDRKPGFVGADVWAGWFDFHHDDGTTALLNGERVCSIATANRNGWIEAAA